MEHRELLTHIRDQVDRLERIVDRLLRIIDGNGEGGLRTDVTVLENRVESLEGGRRRWANIVPGIVLGLVVSLGTAAVFAWAT